MYNSSFFDLVNLLHDKYYSEPPFNLFSVLRSESDEVRLHSRFIGEILDPRGSHNSKGEFLFIFLSMLKIREMKNPKVFIEKNNIDILVESDDIAIVIENKVYARDQERQLARYYDLVKKQHKEVLLVYLTLDGGNPTEQSLLGLSKETIDSKLKCISYKDDLYNWIESCLAISARKPSLRESLSQYLDLIERLTNKITNIKYMNELKDLLLRDNNLENFLDLQQAFQMALVDLQIDVWNRIQKSLEDKYGVALEGPIITGHQKKDTISKFIDARKNSSYYGLHFNLGTGCEDIAIEMQNDGIIAGVRCSSEEYKERYEYLSTILSDKLSYSRSQWWPSYKYLSPKINYRNTTKDSIRFLSEEKNRELIANDAIEIIESIVASID